MYTGIVEELGEVVAIEPVGGSARLTFRGPVVTSDARHGDSIAVNGVCVTVTGASGGEFTVDATAETLRRSSLGSLVAGAPVNLERPARVDDRLGGHIVQGHVDGTGTILERAPADQGATVRVSLPDELARYVVEKGSIAVDGASLTVASLTAGSFTVSLIPTTLDLTTLGSKGVGDAVNLEVDLIAKHVERLMAHEGSRA